MSEGLAEGLRLFRRPLDVAAFDRAVRADGEKIVALVYLAAGLDSHRESLLSDLAELAEAFERDSLDVSALDAIEDAILDRCTDPGVPIERATELLIDVAISLGRSPEMVHLLRDRMVRLAVKREADRSIPLEDRKAAEGRRWLAEYHASRGQS